jgi:hypothetical protein
MDTRKRFKDVRAKIKKDVFDIDEKGKPLVKINITDADSLLSVYNDDGLEIISGETAKFIENMTKPIPAKQEIHLQISCEKYTPDKEKKYKSAITNYYINEFAHRDMKLKRNTILSSVLLLSSIVAFMLFYFLSAITTPRIILDLLEIFAWVLAWEAVDQFFLQRYLIKFDQLKALQIIYAKISFRKLGADVVVLAEHNEQKSNLNFTKSFLAKNSKNKDVK